MTLSGEEIRDSARLWTIVLAAGEGSRLKAFTRALHGEELPKQYAEIVHGRSLLQTTLDRAAAWSPPDRTVVVVAAEREALARAQVRRFDGVEVVCQPANVGTGPGILLPLVHMMRRDPDAIVVIVPSDHYVREDAPFVESVRRAEEMARTRDSVVLVAAVPDRPETQYGWILPGGDHDDRVAGFQEKPDAAAAERLLSAGALWNTFMMVGSARRLWELASAHLPLQAALFDRYRALIGTPVERSTLDRIYREMPSADFSRDVLELSAGLGVVPLSPCGWSDWGTPERVVESLRGSEALRILLDRIRDRRDSGVFAKTNVPAEGHRAA